MCAPPFTPRDSVCSETAKCVRKWTSEAGEFQIFMRFSEREYTSQSCFANPMKFFLSFFLSFFMYYCTPSFNEVVSLLRVIKIYDSPGRENLL